MKWWEWLIKIFIGFPLLYSVFTLLSAMMPWSIIPGSLIIMIFDLDKGLLRYHMFLGGFLMSLFIITDAIEEFIEERRMT